MLGLRWTVAVEFVDCSLDQLTPDAYFGDLSFVDGAGVEGKFLPRVSCSHTRLTRFLPMANLPELAALSARIDQVVKEDDERKAKHKRMVKESWFYQCITESSEILCTGDCCLGIYKRSGSCWNHPCCLPCECVHGLLCCLPACCIGCASAMSDGCCRAAPAPELAVPAPQVMV
jgi:hypothetical protein